MIDSLPRRAFVAACAALVAACASPSRPAAVAAEAVPSAAEPAAAPRPTDPVHLVILHTNDVHGQVLPRKATWIDRESPPPIGGLERLAAEIASQRRQAEDEGAHVIVVDGGDWYQGTPEGALDRGLPFVEALVRVGYDAMSLGNHELDHGLDNARRVVEASHAPAIAANVRERSGERIAWAKPWRIVERAGLSIALVGFLTPSTPSITHEDASRLAFTSAADEYATVERELAGRADWILPVGHIGVDEARELARAHPEVRLVVTGHSHTYLPEGVTEGSTLIVQTGAKAGAVGRVDVWLDPASGRVASTHAALIDLLDESDPCDRDPELARRAAGLVARAETDMATVVGELAAPAERSKGFGSSTAGNWTTDLMRRRTGADVAIHNKGGIRADVAAGPVTRRDLFEQAPFDNTVVSFDLAGAELDELVREATERPRHGGLEYSGLTIRAEADDHGKLTVVSIEVGGEPLDRARRYRVATNSFLAGGGDDLAVLARAGGRREEPLLVRELLEWGLADFGAVTPPSDARCVLVP